MNTNLRDTAKRLIDEINTVLIGKEDKVELTVLTLLAGGHLLLEDVPGVGKTTLANALARATGCDFARIQFTPDTLPGDVTGVSVYRMDSGTFEYVPGAVMHQIVLADEINRTAAKTQASLLEAMEEHQVTVDGVIHPIAEPFMVIATQNPIDFLGTYNLPEAQLDRFLMRISLGYPEAAQEQR
ncbi:MAG: AAA family ATPase, partial [Lachnospiraceae bacterium]|nr:AAA family ATPase [Lachnospiraceae bacterium]